MVKDNNSDRKWHEPLHERIGKVGVANFDFVHAPIAVPQRIVEESVKSLCDQIHVLTSKLINDRHFAYANQATGLMKAALSTSLPKEVLIEKLKRIHAGLAARVGNEFGDD